MPDQKFVYKLEKRMVNLQNAVAELSAKIDAFMTDDQRKKIKAPKKEELPQEPGGTPYTIKDNPPPVSTSDVPVVLPEGQTVAEAKAKEEEPKIDMNTSEVPVTPTPPNPNVPAPAPKTPEEPLVKE